MNEFSKAFLPFLFVVLTSIMGYFFSEVVKELRNPPLLTYTIEHGGDGSTITVRNASSLYIDDALLQIACIDRQCLEALEEGRYIKRGRGRSFITVESSEFAEVSLSLHPRTSAEFWIKPLKRSGSDVDLLYKPSIESPQILTLLRQNRPIALIANNYLEIMTWVFLASLAISFVLLIWTVVLLARSR